MLRLEATSHELDAVLIQMVDRLVMGSEINAAGCHLGVVGTSRMTTVATTRSRKLTSPRGLADRMAMTRDQLFDALSALSATQLDAVVYKLAVPRAILPGRSTPPITVIVEALHWAEQQGRLDDVARLLAEVGAPAPEALAPDAGPAS